MIARTFHPAGAVACLFAGILLSGCASTFSDPASEEIDTAPVDSELDIEPIDDGAPADTGQVVLAVDDDPSGYILGQGDVIGIQVFDEPDLTLEARVGSSGVINYSYLGDIRVKGRTPLELERQISTLLREGYLVNPSVNVTVVEYRPFFINGEVRSPGGYPYQPGLTLDKAISLAGGMTDRASRRKMFVIKALGDSEEQERVGMNYRVAPGDVISIDEGFF